MLSSLEEQERLMIHVAADVALKRKLPGLGLNLPEAAAVIADFLLPDTFVRVDGEPVNHAPVTELPMTQRSFLH